MIVSFFTAYDDEDFGIHDNCHDIACNYLKSWFIIDLIAIVPFDIILNPQAYLSERK